MDHAGAVAHIGPSNATATEPLDDERVARRARQLFGDALPEGHLNPAQYRIFERFYGTPDIVPAEDQLENHEEEDTVALEDLPSGTGILREGPDGSLEEIEFVPELEAEELDEAEPEAFEDMLESPDFLRLRKSKQGKFFAHAKKKELDEKVLYAEMNRADEAALSYMEKDWRTMDSDEKFVYLDDVRYFKLEQFYRDHNKGEEADELLQCLYIFLEARAKKQATTNDPVEVVAEVDQIETEESEQTAQEEEEMPDETIQRTHPFTLENRFGTFPATVTLPYSTFAGPVSAIISGSSPTHLAEAAKRIFGGPGLPYSSANPAFAKAMPQKPIPLDPSQDRMSDIEADAFFAGVMPGTYASLMSVLVETRKRLGGAWLENLINKEGGPRILDAGSAGAGVIAFREVMRAEWERMNDNSEDPDALKDLAPVDGRAGGAPLDAPQGRATVLTGSTTLRHRTSVLLENTTFIPRLPDYVHASNSDAAQQGKFDIILAPHSLWPLREDFLRKQYLANLWSLLNAQGGVLILLEKGVPRGFETIAGARKFLLDSRIASPGHESVAEEEPSAGETPLYGAREKEKGMIVAPCTNHSGCPMYTKPGVSPGRSDFCHFQQRYIRPPYLQKLLNAKDKNHEDVQFSYLSVMRGHDLRDSSTEGVIQGDAATDRAFSGYENMEEPTVSPDFDPTAPAIEDIDFASSETQRVGPHGMSLPRAVMPPLKRTGHVLMDLCTPSGTLERWTVPRSFSKQAFRDARKSSWGDLWALGAKTRIAKNVRLGKDKPASNTINLKAVKISSKAKKIMAEQPSKGKKKKTDIFDVPVNPETGKVIDSEIRTAVGGRMRQGKVSGIRDKRDKSGKGRGRKVYNRD